MTYPGAPFPDELDPLRQEWYLTAKKFPSKVVVTPPRLDQGGAGYILTVSQYVSASGTQNDAGAVIGMDLTKTSVDTDFLQLSLFLALGPFL